MLRVPDFIVDADNVYRTKKYIVKQIITLDITLESTNVKSDDFFYERTKQRDREFENIFQDRQVLNGKRMPSTMCTRKYVDKKQGYING